MTLIKCSTKALVHSDVGEIDYPINIWCDMELHVWSGTNKTQLSSHAFSAHHATVDVAQLRS